MAQASFFPRLKEHDEQAAFFDWMRASIGRYPETDPLFFAVSNGAQLAGDNRMRAIQVQKLKREGFQPGVSDTVFLSGHGGRFGLVMEFKREKRRREKNGGLSEVQQEFLKAARLEGYSVNVVYNAEEAIEAARVYLNQPPTQEMIGQALKHLKAGDPAAAQEILERIVLSW